MKNEKKEKQNLDSRTTNMIERLKKLHGSIQEKILGMMEKEIQKNQDTAFQHDYSVSVDLKHESKENLYSSASLDISKTQNLARLLLSQKMLNPESGSDVEPALIDGSTQYLILSPEDLRMLVELFRKVDSEFLSGGLVFNEKEEEKVKSSLKEAASDLYKSMGEGFKSMSDALASSFSIFGPPERRSPRWGWGRRWTDMNPYCNRYYSYTERRIDDPENQGEENSNGVRQKRKESQ